MSLSGKVFEKLTEISKCHDKKPLKSTGEVVPTFGSGEECADDVNFNLCCSYSKYNS